MLVYGITSLIAVPLESGIPGTADSEDTEPRMRVFYKAINVVAGPVQKCELRGFVVKTRKLAE